MTEQVKNELDKIHLMVIEADEFLDSVARDKGTPRISGSKFDWLKKQILGFNILKNTQIIYYHKFIKNKVILQNAVLSFDEIKKSDFYKKFIKGH